MRRFMLAVSLATVVGCGSSQPAEIVPDGGVTPDAKSADAAVAQLACSSTRVLPEYPWGVTAGAYLTDQQMTFGIMADSTNTAASRLWIEVWPGAGGAAPVIPTQRTLSTADRYKSCENCVLIGEGCTTQPNTCRTYYYAQAGQLRIDEATRSQAGGRLRAVGTNVTLAEWSITNDAPVPDGRCIEITKFVMDAEWGPGGACSGDSCNTGCCMDSPYCSLGNSSTGRFCSDYCGESGDTCKGLGDCCNGFKCFLGTCIADSCSGGTCSSGLDESGGCCDQAAYCVGGHCSAACGMAGSGCGGDLDCCTGLACSGGTCQ